MQYLHQCPSTSRTPKKTCILHPHSSHTTSECRVIQEQLAKEKESPRPPVHQRKSNNERKEIIGMDIIRGCHWGAVEAGNDDGTLLHVVLENLLQLAGKLGDGRTIEDILNDGQEAIFPQLSYALL
ncbi:unnamed protein product [Lepeophtheirus salmonis]|uniref:(salmon louse) hypothetical protein n=1 Tax=Lepeophtheirus salmonis TaxID=72036 RepID=A0A7R8H6G9_LEPSM|nr:unnamed protein product [Lepeophtheirus salmonis]CAF2901327.1 unnamed protein product [Lepeophtheirus salmonis]